jgi:hypothetical protein
MIRLRVFIQFLRGLFFKRRLERNRECRRMQSAKFILYVLCILSLCAPGITSSRTKTVMPVHPTFPRPAMKGGAVYKNVAHGAIQ